MLSRSGSDLNWLMTRISHRYCELNNLIIGVINEAAMHEKERKIVEDMEEMTLGVLAEVKIF